LALKNFLDYIYKENEKTSLEKIEEEDEW